MEKKASVEKPMMRVCCFEGCKIIYGCFDGVNTKDCGLCFDNQLCMHKVYHQFPDNYSEQLSTYPDATHGVCYPCLQTKLKK